MICGEWFRTGNIEPSIEFGHFFASPIRVTSTGPSTICGVIDAHLSLCSQALILMKQATDEAKHAFKKSPFNPQQYSMLSLYRAVIVILDEFDGSSLDAADDPDGFFNLRKGAQLQTVSIARTGAKTGLSAPISFESLRSNSFPLRRPDVVGSDIDVVRVSITVAVKFIASLEQREELAFLELKKEPFSDEELHPSAPEGFDENYQIRRNAETWADAVIAAAETQGYDKIPEAQESIRRVRAELAGEKYFELEHVPFENRLRYGDD